jgi:hypothetical protein
MAEHGDKDIDVDPTVGGTEPGEGDSGWAGGGGPASTIDEDAEAEGHLADTDHSVS